MQYHVYDTPRLFCTWRIGLGMEDDCQRSRLPSLSLGLMRSFLLRSTLYLGAVLGRARVVPMSLQAVYMDLRGKDHV